MSRDSLPTVNPQAFPSERPRNDAITWGIVLAAGTSSRYGDENKLLTTLDGTPLIRHATETLVKSKVAGVTVIVGYESERVRDALADLDVEIQENPAFAEGQNTSIREGVLAVKEHDADALLVALGDMPSVDRSTVDLLIEAYERGIADIIAAAADGVRGNPVLFDAHFFEMLANIEGDTGGRDLLIELDEAVAIETTDHGVLRDVDRPSDFSKFS